MKIDNKKYLKVPDNYFNELPHLVMSNISGLEKSKSTPELKVMQQSKTLKSRFPLFATISGIVAAAAIIMLFVLPTDYSPLHSNDQNTTKQDLLVTQGDYYLFIEDMQEDTMSEDYWMSMAEQPNN